MKRIVILSARVGAGHDGAAGELTRRMRDRGFEVTQHDFLDLLPGRLGQRLCDTYRRQLKMAPRSWDWLLSAMDTRGGANLAVRFAKLAAPNLMATLDPALDLVVSTYPLASQAMAHLRAKKMLSTPLAIYLTDPSIHRLCVTKHPAVHIAPNDVAAAQARLLGAEDVVVAEPVAAPAFRPPKDSAEIAQARAFFGLPSGKRLALVLAGSWGVGQVEQIARDVAASEAALPVVVCGRNDDLLRQLKRREFPYVYGWVGEMPALMRACDVAVQNAGGLTTAEALASDLPVLTYRCLPGHGRPNARVLHDIGLVPWIREPDELAAALSTAVSPARRRPLPDPASVLETLSTRPAPAVAVISA